MLQIVGANRYLLLLDPHIQVHLTHITEATPTVFPRLAKRPFFLTAVGEMGKEVSAPALMSSGLAQAPDNRASSVMLPRKEAETKYLYFIMKTYIPPELSYIS